MCSLSHLTSIEIQERGTILISLPKMKKELEGLPKITPIISIPMSVPPAQPSTPFLSYRCLWLPPSKEIYTLIKEQGAGWVHISSGNFPRWPSVHDRTLFWLSLHLSICEETIIKEPMMPIIMYSFFFFKCRFWSSRSWVGPCYFILFFLNLFILFLAVLGLRFCARAFSSCGKRGPLFIAVRGPLTIAASLVAEHRLQLCRLSNCGSRA